MSDSDELAAALHEARQTVATLAEDPEFQALCRERDIAVGPATDDSDEPVPAGFHYWFAAADYAYKKYNDLRAQGTPEKDIVLKELFLVTPDFLYDQRYLDRHHADHDNPNVRGAKQTASYYNGLLRSAAREWPELSPKQLAEHLVEVADDCIANKHLKEASPFHIHDAVRGAEHEYKFGQFLARTGRHFREAEVDEDIRGIDYVVTDPDGRPTHYIDVKASQNQMIHDGHPNWTYERTHDGHLIMYSMVPGHELGDSFEVPEDIAIEKAHHLEKILHETARHY